MAAGVHAAAPERAALSRIMREQRERVTPGDPGKVGRAQPQQLHLVQLEPRVQPRAVASEQDLSAPPLRTASRNRSKRRTPDVSV